MNEDDLRMFQRIKEKAEKDRVIWDQAQQDECSADLSPEDEEIIMERMFLVNYTEKYLEQQSEIERLTQKLNQTEEYQMNKQDESKRNIVVEKTNELQLNPHYPDKQITKLSEEQCVDKQQAINVLNSMPIIDTDNDGDACLYIYVENSQENREKLMSLGFAEKHIANGICDYNKTKDVIDLNQFAWEFAEWFDAINKKFLEHDPSNQLHEAITRIKKQYVAYAAEIESDDEDGAIDVSVACNLADSVPYLIEQIERLERENKVLSKRS